jgi:hypothetical protein
VLPINSVTKNNNNKQQHKHQKLLTNPKPQKAAFPTPASKMSLD